LRLLAVILREKKEIAGKEIEVEVYKTEGILSKEERRQAEELDKYLSKKMKQVEQGLKREGFLKLKGKSGVIKLWFELGRQLKFVDESKLISPADKRWLWRAFYDHAPNLAPGPPSVRANERPENSHFYYCYLLAQKFPNIGFIEKAGDWTAWVEFLDSPSIREDRRIIEWLASSQKYKGPSAKQDWLRNLTREIRQTFPYRGAKTDTSVYTDQELKTRLDRIFETVYGGL
jgi:hypothetical protein